jgi:hypothetical protein
MTAKLLITNRLNIFCLGIFVLLILATCIGCQSVGNPLSNPSNSSPNLSDDLPSLLKEQAKLTLYEPEYHMTGDAKSGIYGICEFKAFPQDINNIGNALDMSEIKDDKTLKYIHYDATNSKLGTLFSQGKDVRAYGVFSQTAKLKCKNGQAFEYMLLFYYPEENKASLETKYAAS